MNDGERKKGVSSGSSFVDIVTTCYFVDKSLLIKELLDDCDGFGRAVKIITRPRRFGKSVNLDMVKTFFERTDGDTSVYFKDLKIWECGEKYTSEQGRYPVIYLDLKEVVRDSLDGAMALIKDSLSVEFLRHKELMTSESVEQVHDLTMYKKIAEMRASEDEMVESLQLLSRMLYDHHKIKPIILIDEYDAPYQTGCDMGYSNEILDFLTSFFSAAFEGNGEFLKFGVLTGITKVFDKGTLDGVEYCPVLDKRYDKYFGFTKEETSDFLDYFDRSDKKTEVGDLYGGYRFGTCGDMHNPWAVSHYLYNRCAAKAYWSDTSSNPVIKEAVAVSKKVAKNLMKLSRGETVSVPLSKGLLYSDERNEKNIYAVLVEAGYLTPVSVGGGKYAVKIPNRDVSDAFSSLQNGHFET